MKGGKTSGNLIEYASGQRLGGNIQRQKEREVGEGREEGDGVRKSAMWEEASSVYKRRGCYFLEFVYSWIGIQHS